MMKKQLLLATTLLMVFMAAKAQKPDTARVLVHYKFTHIGDTTDRAHPYTENMALFVGKNASAYKSYDGFIADQQFRNAWAAAVASSPDGQPRINRRGVGTRTQYYQYPNTKKMLTKDNLAINEYLVDGPLPAIAWQIGSDTASFGGLHCQKATGHFKGRDYIVWFCPDLPLPAGPWKLNGLPGVIVDAHDTRNEVIFQFDGLEKVVFAEVKPIGGAGVPDKDLPPILRGLDDNPNLIAPPARAIKATQKEFDELQAAIKKNPNAVGQAMVAGNRAAGVKTDNIRMAPGPGPRGPVTNNPIELPEKK
jgi:GLPGLI family protein